MRDALIPLLTVPKQMDFPFWGTCVSHLLPICAYKQDINLRVHHSANDRLTSHIIAILLEFNHNQYKNGEHSQLRPQEVCRQQAEEGFGPGQGEL